MQWVHKRYLKGIVFAIMLMLTIATPISLFAAGDTTNGMGQVPTAVATGDMDSLTWNQSPNASDLLTNFTNNSPQLMRFVTAFAYVFGIFLMTMGVGKLKQYGEQRTQMSGQHHLTAPMMYLLSGALLLWLPATVQVGLLTFWSKPIPYAYQTSSSDWIQNMNSVFLAVQLFGTIALVRGLIMISKLGGGHGQPGAFPKAMTHIIGGLLCINLYGLVSVVLVTFGFLS